MSRVIGQGNSTRKPGLKLGQRFKTLALGVSLGLPLLAVFSQTGSVFAQQEPPGAKVQVSYDPRTEAPRTGAPRTGAEDGARLPDPSALDIPSLIRDCDRLGTAMHLRLPEYTYIQTRLSRELDQRGKLVERVSAYEAYPITVLGQQRHVISLINENGAPLSAKRLKKERQQAAKEIETAERESALQGGGEPTPGAERYVTAGIGVSQDGDGVWVGVSQ